MPDNQNPLFAISQRQPPTNTAAEQALLGAILANARSVHRVLDFLKPIHFADPLHGRIYAECVKRVMNGGVPDAVSMRTWFENDPEVEAVGVAYLGQLLSAMVGIINAREYGLVIFDTWQRRELIELGEGLVNSSFSQNSDDTPAVLSAALIDKLDKVVSGSTPDRGLTSLDDAVAAMIEDARMAQERQGPAGISTGMPNVDRAIGGLERQTMTVVAGRPGMGKSALAMEWCIPAARNALEAFKAGKPKEGVLVISLEMSALQQARRAVSSISRVPLEAMKYGRLGQYDWDKIVQAQHELHGLPLSIEDMSGLNIGMIRLRARTARRKHGLGLIVIDHMHIIAPEAADAKNGGTWAIGRISNGLKALAKEFDCPVLALAQLNRGLESRDEKRPGLSDLRQAGEIEQDADAVGFIYRPEYYLPKGEPERTKGEKDAEYINRCDQLAGDRVRLKGRAELIWEKVRDGSPCVNHLMFDGPTTSFREA